MSTRLPDPPGSLPSLQEQDTRIVAAGIRVARIYNRLGDHPTRPDQLRSYGPVPTARFDHHPPPVRTHVTAGRVTAATGHYGVMPLDDPRIDPLAPLPPDQRQALAPESPVVTAVAEAFQSDRSIAVSGRQALAVATLSGDCEVLDLTSGWATRAGVGNHLATGPHATTRRWARAIRAAYPALAGLYWHSSVHPPGRALLLNEGHASHEGVVAMRLDYDDALDAPFTRLLLAEIRALIGYGLSE